MTDLNISLTNAETGEIEDRFSVHRGGASSMVSLIAKVRDSIRSEMDIDCFVRIAQEKETMWEVVAPFLSRIVVPGGWLYWYRGHVKMIYVPDPNYRKNKYNAAGTLIGYDAGTEDNV